MSTYNPEQELIFSSVPKVEIQDVLKWVYLWMSVGLLITFGVSLAVASNEALAIQLFSGPWLWIALVAELIMVMALSAAIMRLSVGAAAMLFLGYAALNGLTMAGIFYVYTLSDISTAFLATAGVFGAMTVVGFTTKMDLSKWGTYLFMGVIGVFIALLINLFLQSSAFELLISIAGVILFTALTAYDTQKIRRMAADPNIRSDGSLTMKVSILGALRLYLDFINLFLFILRILGRRR